MAEGREPTAEWQRQKWPEWVKQPLIVLDEVDSTNSYALRLARQERAPEGTVVVAECQSAGRGRRERRWFSPRGLSIYASIILRPRFSPRFAQLPTLLASAAAAAAIHHLYALPARVKWPNDIQLEGKKLGGILTESAVSKERIEFLVVGVGLNCNVAKEDWPDEVRPVATSIREVLGQPIDRSRLLSQLLRILARDYELCQNQEYEAAVRGWRSLNMTLGSQVALLLPGRQVQGVAEDLLMDGTLRLRDNRTGDLLDVTLGEMF